jgi:hypothetical protein
MSVINSVWRQLQAWHWYEKFADENYRKWSQNYNQNWKYKLQRLYI